MLVVVAKVLQALLLGPGLLLTAALVALLLAILKKRRAALAVTCAACLLMAALSLRPVSDLLLRPLELRYPALPMDLTSVEADAIVLLGAGTAPAAPDAGGQDALNGTSTLRTLYAAALQRRLGLPVIATGGRIAPSSAIEAEAAVAARLLEELGVSAKQIRQEGESRTTWENAKNVYDAWKPSRMVLVTSAVHMPRAAACFARLGIEVLPAPTDYLSGRSGTYLDWLPSWPALDASLAALHEYAGLLGYRALYGARPPARAAERN